MDLQWGQNISGRLEDPDFPPQPCGMTQRLAEHPRTTFKFTFQHRGRQEGRFALKKEENRSLRECFSIWSETFKPSFSFTFSDFHDVLTSLKLELLWKSINVFQPRFSMWIGLVFRFNRCGFKSKHARFDRPAAFGPERADKESNYP